MSDNNTQNNFIQMRRVRIKHALNALDKNKTLSPVERAVEKLNLITKELSDDLPYARALLYDIYAPAARRVKIWKHVKGVDVEKALDNPNYKHINPRVMYILERIRVNTQICDLVKNKFHELGLDADILSGKIHDDRSLADRFLPLSERAMAPERRAKFVDKRKSLQKRRQLSAASEWQKEWEYITVQRKLAKFTKHDASDEKLFLDREEYALCEYFERNNLPFLVEIWKDKYLQQKVEIEAEKKLIRAEDVEWVEEKFLELRGAAAELRSEIKSYVPKEGASNLYTALATLVIKDNSRYRTCEIELIQLIKTTSSAGGEGRIEDYMYSRRELEDVYKNLMDHDVQPETLVKPIKGSFASQFLERQPSREL